MKAQAHVASHHEGVLNLRAGDMVEVRSKSEILATLDATGRKEALPFMPEMLQYCGKRFRVYKRADKACDTIGKTGSRRMEDAVHLEDVRCDGLAHGGCQAGCLIYWKEAWLKRVDTPRFGGSIANTGEPSAVTNPQTESPGNTGACTEEKLFSASRRQSGQEEIFSCQATELPKATSYLAWWDIRQYIRDITSRNIGLVELSRAVSISLFNAVIRNVRQGVLVLGRWLVSRPVVNVQRAGGNCEPMPGFYQAVPPGEGVVEHMKNALDELFVEHPHVRGKLRKTPSTVLNLQPGELVQIKTREEILATLDINNRNRGLWFDVEMVPYCGGNYRVLRRVDKIVDEKTGRMLVLSNNCIILEGVFCRGCLSRNRLFCPRSIYQYWHEIWLRRAE